MVILGGLEFVAAGYVLNEMHNNNKKSTQNTHSSSDPNRRKKKHRHDHEHRHDRPSRPPTSNLAVPGAMGRPSSAPPPQNRPPPPMGMGGPMGPQAPYYHPPAHEVMQFPPNPRPQPPPQPIPQMRPPQTQSWPVHMPSQARPPTNSEAAQYFNGPQQQRPMPQQQNSMPMPGNLHHNPTMHFDTKTGKWQSGMLPTEAQTAAGNRSLSNVDGPGGKRSVSPLVHDAIVGMKGGRKGSYSSVSSASSGSSDSDLAYGKDYGKRRQPTRVMSAERERPLPQVRVGQHQAPVELDWYATQSKKAPAMAGVAAKVMSRDGLGVPAHAQYSSSQPDLGVYEMDGTSWGGRGSSQVRPVEMDARETERYRAYRP